MFEIADTTPANDVWGMLLGTAGNVFAAREAGRTKRAELSLQADVARAQSQAAPTGVVESWFRNPLPGMFSAFPQADTKAQTVSSGMSPSALIWIAVAAVVTLIVFRFAR